MTHLTIGGRTYDIEVRGDSVFVDGHEYPITVREESGYSLVTAGGTGYRVQLPGIAERSSGMDVHVDYRPFTIEFDGKLGGGGPARSPRAAGTAAVGAAGGGAAIKGGVRAQIAGRILSLNVKVGDSVARGDVLLLLEAMKMENEIKAPHNGKVKEILVLEGARVAEGETLVVLE
jgi:glutaconyl-CoA/methylmalonyl-CoA decarboxylase subunit gamma